MGIVLMNPERSRRVYGHLRQLVASGQLDPQMRQATVQMLNVIAVAFQSQGDSSLVNDLAQANLSLVGQRKTPGGQQLVTLLETAYHLGNGQKAHEYLTELRRLAPADASETQMLAGLTRPKER